MPTAHFPSILSVALTLSLSHTQRSMDRSSGVCCRRRRSRPSSLPRLGRSTGQTLGSTSCGCIALSRPETILFGRALTLSSSGVCLSGPSRHAVSAMRREKAADSRNSSYVCRPCVAILECTYLGNLCMGASAITMGSDQMRSKALSVICYVYA